MTDLIELAKRALAYSNNTHYDIMPAVRVILRESAEGLREAAAALAERPQWVPVDAGLISDDQYVHVLGIKGGVIFARDPWPSGYWKMDVPPLPPAPGQEQPK